MSDQDARRSALLFLSSISPTAQPTSPSSASPPDLIERTSLHQRGRTTFVGETTTVASKEDADMSPPLTSSGFVRHPSNAVDDGRTNSKQQTKHFTGSKRQAAFLLSINSLPGAPATHPSMSASDGVQRMVDSSNVSVDSLLPRDASVASMEPYGSCTAKTTATAVQSVETVAVDPHGKSSVPLWVSALSKQGDCVRLKMLSLHGDPRKSSPVIVTTVLATYLERRPVTVIGGQRVLEGASTHGNGVGGEGARGGADARDGDAHPWTLSRATHSNERRGGGGEVTSHGVSPSTAAATLAGGAGLRSAPSFGGNGGGSVTKVSRHGVEVSYASKFLISTDDPHGGGSAVAALSPQFTNPFYLDDPDITGERRRKRMNLRSYVCTVISFADKRREKKDINQQFFLRHPSLELRDIKLSHIRSVKTSLLQLCLEDQSPVELCTIAYAAWYWERLVTALQVTKQNRKLMVAICVTLAIKFWESGTIGKKLSYAWAKMEELFGVDTASIKALEFEVFVALEFTLLPPSFDIGRVYMERLLHIMNITMQEYYSKNFDLMIHWD